MSISMMSYLTHFAGRLFISSLIRLEYTGMVVTLLFHCLLPMDDGKHSSRATHARWAFFILRMTPMQILMNSVSGIYKLHLLSRPSILLIALSISSIGTCAKIQSISYTCLVEAIKFVWLMKRL